MSPPARRWWTFGLVVALSGLFFIDFCDLLFGCGCRPLWAGGATGCNTHAAMPPHCPWCRHPLGGAIAYAAVTVVQALVVFRALDRYPLLRLGAALAMLPLVGGAVGLLQGWWWGYWS